MIRMIDFQGHYEYSIKYWFCEILCLVNVITQVLALDIFLKGNGAFLTYGLTAFELIDLDAEKIDYVMNFPGMTTMDKMFPMRAKCTFYKLGLTGTMETRDVLCVLALNSYNRYIYLFMWFWFMILIVLLALLFVYRILLILFPSLRSVLLRTPGKNDLRCEMNFIARALSVTDWWVLYSLKANVSSILFKDIIRKLYAELSSAKAPALAESGSEPIVSDSPH